MLLKIFGGWFFSYALPGSVIYITPSEYCRHVGFWSVTRGTHKYFTRQIRECWEKYSQLIEDHGDVLQLYGLLPGLFQPGDPPVHVCHRVRASYHFNGVREPRRVWSLRYCELRAVKERPRHVETLESMPEQVDSVS